MINEIQLNSFTDDEENNRKDFIPLEENNTPSSSILFDENGQLFTF